MSRLDRAVLAAIIASHVGYGLFALVRLTEKHYPWVAFFAFGYMIFFAGLAIKRTVAEDAEHAGKGGHEG